MSNVKSSTPGYLNCLIHYTLWFNRIQKNELYVFEFCYLVMRERKITLIKDISPMNLNMAIKGRCISVWHSHKLNEEHDPYSIDFLFQDEEVT